MAPEPAERLVQVGDVRLAVADRPGGEPAILLLHGLASTSRIWDLVAPRLAPASRVVAFDQRGHGRSSKPTAGYGFRTVVGDALSLIRRLRLDRPVIVGHSWGANVALELAATAPARVRGAVLVDGGFLSLRERMDWPTTRERLSPPPLRGMPLEEFRRGMRAHLPPELPRTPEVEAVLQSLVRVDRSGRIHPRLNRTNHLRILRALWQQDVHGLLRSVRVPTLVLAARSSSHAPEERRFALEKRRAAAVVRSIGDPVRFEWIEGIHDVPLQRPLALARRIARFSREAVR